MGHPEAHHPAVVLLGLLGGGDPAAEAWVAAAQGRWREQAALASRHRVSALLYRRLLTRPPAVPPDPATLATLKRTYLSTLGENERARRQLAEISAGLGERGIAPVLLKGAHLAFGVYPDPATRPMSDLDLLVRPEQLPETTRELERLGYVPMTPYSREAEFAHHAHLPAFVAPGRLPVEVHWRLLLPEDPYRTDETSLIGRSRPFAVIGAGARVLDPADAFVYLALHAVARHHLEGGVRVLADLAFSLAAAPDDQSWREARLRVAAAGADRVLGLALALLERLPPGWSPRTGAIAHPTPAVEPAMLDLALDLALSLPPETAAVTPNLAALVSSGPLAAARLLLARAFPSRSEMAVLHPGDESEPAGLLRYPRRWALLITRHGPAAWRLLRGSRAAIDDATRIERGRQLAQWCARSVPAGRG